MKKNVVSSVLILAVLLTACAPGSSQPTATPTQYPTPETVAPPTDAPAAVPTVSRPQPAAIDVALLENDWHWIGLTDPTQQIAIETPANYVLSFQGDGSVLIKADCNNATGSYTTANGAITIAVGPMTLAACPPDSRSDQFVKLLGNAARYHFKDGNLYIDLKADGGTLAFASPNALSGDDSAGNGAGALPADVTAQLDKWLQSLASSESVDPKVTAPGLVLLIDSPQGRYLKAVGVSSLEKGTPLQPDDRLEIGSNTKSFTVALIMQLQEEGLLSMDDPYKQVSA
jgi:heat shock protein HslJ